MATSTLTGLTEAEVTRRRAAGQGNNIDLTPSRSYWQILYANLFTFVNLVLIAIGVLLVVLASPADALTTTGLVILNVLIGVIQEARAKQKLDQITLLARPKVTVIRDGSEKNIDPSELVLGDWVSLKAGDQAMSDGVVVGSGRAELDESLLTGESDFIPKAAGDEIFAGSLCMTGGVTYETTKVGADSLANKITAKARQFTSPSTPLQEDINTIVRLVGLISALVGVLLYIQLLRSDAPALERVQMAAVVMGTIPQGLIFLVTLSYALGSVRIAGKGALIQQANAVESMSNVNVLCLDKTGTLTTNAIRYHALWPYEQTETEFTRLLTCFAHSATSSNRTSDAIRTQFSQPNTITTTEEIPFSSSYKWSGMSFNTSEIHGVYVLGAPEVLQANLHSGWDDLTPQISNWAEEGLRVVLFAHSPDLVTLKNAEDKPQLPTKLIPLGLIALSDELRPEAKATLEAFSQAGIGLKIISGDNPRTVAALARQAGFDTSGGIVSGLDLAQMSNGEFAQAAIDSAVFGRITPDQKEALVKAMQAQGGYVAMIGDGVNDVMSLKQANIGIAMQSGSTATRNVADIVLLNDSFAVLPSVFTEGQRIVNTLQDTMRLLLTRTFYVTLFIIGAAMLSLPFPFLPTQDSLNSFLTAGLPPILLAFWARSGQPPQQRLLNVFRFVLPAALTLSMIGLALYAYLYDQTDSLDLARSAATTMVITCGSLLILFIKPPASFWSVVEPLAGDWKVSAVGPAMLALLGIILVVEPLRDFFVLPVLEGQHYALIGVAAITWMVVYRLLLANRITERFLGLKS